MIFLLRDILDIITQEFQLGEIGLLKKIIIIGIFGNLATKYTPGLQASYDSILTDHNPSQLCGACMQFTKSIA